MVLLLLIFFDAEGFDAAPVQCRCLETIIIDEGDGGFFLKVTILSGDSNSNNEQGSKHDTSMFLFLILMLDDDVLLMLLLSDAVKEWVLFFK